MEQRSTLKLKQNVTSLFLLFFALTGFNSAQAQSGQQCFIKSSDPATVNAKITWTYNASDQTYTIRTTFSKGFVDNTYGTNAVGWSSGHKFNDLVGSDHVQLALYDNSGAKKMEFKIDYISASKNTASGYETLGVTGGDGKMLTGNASDVVSVNTAMNDNFNKYGYVLTANSPATDANYTPNATYPNWIYDVWYEVKVKASAFGASGFGSPAITSVHASPSKTGNNSETVIPGSCPGTMKLGNLIFDDKNENGMLDAGETGISGMVINLYKDADGNNSPDGAVVASTTSDANGNYYFSNLDEGKYLVGVMKSNGYSMSGTSMQSSSPDFNLDNDNNGVNDAGNEIRTNFITLTKGNEPSENSNSNFTLDIGLHKVSSGPNGGELCFASPANASCVNARAQYSINPSNNTVTIRVIFSRCFVDNTYGTNAVGWSKGHKFGDLTGSDHVELALFDGQGTKKMDFKIDYLSASSAAPSGYKSLGVSGGDGKMILGSASDVVSTKTAMDANFNDFGYVLTTNSPATDANYTPNATYPNWIYDVWYEATVKLSAFGTAGFGNIDIASVHASPSKTGNNTENVDPVDCPKQLRLGNQVFKDLNNNGVKDAGEPGMNGVTVKLYADGNADNSVDGAAIATTTTSGDGNYSFSGLAAGNYIVGVTIPGGYQKGDVGVANANNDVDNDNNGVNTAGAELRSNYISLSVLGEPTSDGDDNNSNMTLDFGLKVQVASGLNLGNAVWNDQNDNGIKDAGEPGMNGLTVKLYKDVNGDNRPDGAAIGTTTTNPSGVYNFTNLDEGRYIVGVVLPFGYMGAVATSTSLSPDNNVDNDNNGIITMDNDEVFTYGITLSANGEPTNDGDGANGNLTLDIGLEACGGLIIGDYVWDDTNGNGVQDADEYGIGGVQVTLTLPDGSIQVTTSDADGYYYFQNLPDGTYNVCFQTPAGYRPTVANAGPDDRDSDPVNGCTNVTISGPVGTTKLDAGFTQVKLNLGNRVFQDKNENGVWDAGEPGIQGLTVRLYRDNNKDNSPDGAAIATQTTDSNGNFNFTNLSEGNYLVSVQLVPNVWANGPILTSGTNPNNDVDNDNNGVINFNNEVFSFYITLTAGGEPTNDGDGADGNQTLDFGLITCPPPPATVNLGNKIWNDVNNNGRMEADEPGIGNLKVRLYEDANGDNMPDGPAIDSVFTSGAGVYGFSNLDNGKYIVGVVFSSTAYGKATGPVGTGANPDNDIIDDNNGVNLAGNSEVRTNAISLEAGTEPINDGDGANGNLTLNIGLLEKSGGPLPVTLVQFNGTGAGSKAILNWKVTNETAMLNYVVERSTDGITFSDAGTVTSLNSGQMQDYSLTDVNTNNAAVVYYRLRSVAQNARTVYSNIVAIRFGAVKGFLSLYPNPVNSYVVVNMTVTEQTKGTLRIMNAAGQVVLTKQLNLAEGSNAITVHDLNRLVNGAYYVSVGLASGEVYGEPILIKR